MRKKANNIIPTSIDGKMQPQAVELEEIVLGAMILENEQLEAVITILKPENFYHPSHQSIYRAITDLFNSSNPVDLRTVPEQCRKNGEYDIAGGHYYISTLTDRVASSANCEYHARIILQKYLARESIRLSTENIQNLYNDETDIEEEIESDISKKTALINNDNSDNNYQIGEVNKAGLILLDKIRCGEVESGIHIGFLGLQRKLGGWHYSDFIIIAARPAMGKTAFALQLIIKPALTHKIPTAIFSLEMSKEQLIIRIQSDYSYYPAERLRTGEITNDVINSISKSTEFLDKLPVYINDKAAITVSYLRAKAKKLCKKQGVKLIVIDYLQLMKSELKQGNREQEISYISSSLKSLSKELNIPIIALSQLSREVEKRGGGKRPQLSDLRESGSLEQDTDIVGFIHRPEYYDINELVNGEPSAGMAEIIIAKNRHGATFTSIIGFEAANVRFYDLERNEPSALQPNYEFNRQSETKDPF